jgi:hypothetical protein
MTPATRQPDQHPDLFAVTDESVSVKWLENLLRGAGCWMTARDISLTTRGKAHERILRELASASDQIISGQKGYKHVEHGTAEEIAHASNWLVSQGKKMIKRGLNIRRAGHRRIG